MGQATTVSTGNAFLDHLPRAVRARIDDAAERVRFVVRDSLYARGESIEHAHFPLDSVISNVRELEDGAQIEVGIVGREGMAGFHVVLTDAPASSTLYVQIAGTALKIPRATIVRIADDSLQSRRPFLAYAELQLSALAQYAACNSVHPLGARFARWLLMAHDRLPSDSIPLTQEFLALMLGVRRAGVSLAAAGLQKAGVIHYSRGAILVLDRPKLQAASCECYNTVEDRSEALLGFSIRKWRR